MARELERLEVAHWRVLVSDPSVYARVEAAIVESLPKPDEELDALRRQARALISHVPSDPSQWEATAAQLASHLHRLDINRSLVRVAHIALRKFADRDKCGASLAKRAERARRAQQRLKNEIVAQNLKLVVMIARRYRFPQMSLADLVQEGSLGLIKAVERFDHRLGFRFSTYASWWIRHAIKRGVADKSRTIRIPTHMVETRARVARAKRALEARSGHVPNLAAVAKAAGLPEAKVAVAEALPSAQLSLDVPIEGDDGMCFKDLLVGSNDDDPLQRISMDNWLRWLPQWMDCLGPLELQITRWRFGLDSEQMTLREIGERYGLSRERIRQLQEQAMSKIRSQRLRLDAEQEGRPKPTHGS